MDRIPPDQTQRDRKQSLSVVDACSQTEEFPAKGWADRLRKLPMDSIASGSFMLGFKEADVRREGKWGGVISEL
jgi:hypothetical protein